MNIGKAHGLPTGCEPKTGGVIVRNGAEYTYTYDVSQLLSDLPDGLDYGTKKIFRIANVNFLDGGYIDDDIVSITVLFGTSGGSKVTSQTVSKNGTVKEPTEAPTKENFDFAGWYKDKELKTKYDFSEKVIKDSTLYATWTEKDNKDDKDNSANQIILTIGEKAAIVFGTKKLNDVEPLAVNNRTMLPARFIAENLGAKVEWNADNNLVTISGKNRRRCYNTYYIGNGKGK